MITLTAIHGSQVFHVASRDPKAGPLCGRGKDSATTTHFLPGDDAGRAAFHKRRGCVGCSKKLAQQLTQAEEMAHTFASVLAGMATTPTRARRASDPRGVSAAHEMTQAGLLEHKGGQGYLLTDAGRRAAGVAAMVNATDVMAKALRRVGAPLLAEDAVTADLKAKGLVFGAVRPSLPQDAGDRRCPVKLDPRSADDTEPWIIVNEDGSPIVLDTDDIEAGVYVTRFAHFEVDPCATIEQAVYAHLPHNFAELDGRLNAQQRTMIDGATAVEVHGEERWIAAENLANVGSLAELVSLGLAYRSTHSVHGHHYLTQAGRNLATYRRVFVPTES